MPFFALTNELLEKSFIVEDWKIAKALKTLMPIANINIFENQEEADTHVAAFRNFVLRKKCDNNNKSVEKKQFENLSDPTIHIKRISNALIDLHSTVKLSPIIVDQVNILKTDVFCKLKTLVLAIKKEFEEDIKSPKKLPTSKPFTPRTIDEQHSVSFNTVPVATNILPDSLNTSPSASLNQSLTSIQLSTDKANTKLTPTYNRHIRRRKKKALEYIFSSAALNSDNNCSEVNIDENHVHAETTSDNLDDSTVLPSKIPRKLPTSKPFTPRIIDEQHSMPSVTFNTLPVATNILPDSLNTSPFASLNQSLTSTQLSTDKANTKLTPTTSRSIRRRKRKALDSIVSSVALHSDNNCSEINIDENHVHAETTSDNLDDSTVIPSKIPSFIKYFFVSQITMQLPTSKLFTPRTIEEHHSMSSVNQSQSINQSLTSTQLSTDKANTNFSHKNKMRNIRKRKRNKILKALKKNLRKKCDNNNTIVDTKQFENPSDPIIDIKRINIAFNNLHSSVKLSPIFDDQVNVLKTEVFCKQNTLMFATEKEFEEDIKSPKNKHFTSEKSSCDEYIPSIEEDMEVINEILGDTPVQQTAIPRSETSTCYQETAATNKAFKTNAC